MSGTKPMSARQSILSALAARLFGKRSQRLARDTRASVALEFGILAVPFFALIGATLETAVMFLTAQILDSAVQDASRLIRTGQAEDENFNEVSFRAAVCERTYGLFNCNAFRIRVNTLTDFASASPPPPTDNSGNWTVVPSYNDGEGSSIVMVEVYYKWPVILNFGGFSLQDQPDRTRLLSAMRVFKNEPF